jgi:hypothetical protein
MKVSVLIEIDDLRDGTHCGECSWGHDLNSSHGWFCRLFDNENLEWDSVEYSRFRCTKCILAEREVKK